MQNVGIITLYRGYNYGTSLQAYALKKVIGEFGYYATILWTDENAHSGRDIRINKVLRMGFRMLIHPDLFKHTIEAYNRSLRQPLDDAIKSKFIEFEKKHLQVKGLPFQKLKNFAYAADTQALVCGSDQIWSAAGANIEPLYYLQFAPQNKRVAYAPSFGASEIPAYNKALIKKYLQGFHRISVREKRGAEIVKELLGIDVPVLIDPTLLLDWNEWKGGANNKDYILLYFLDEPSDDTIDYIQWLADNIAAEVYALPYRFKKYEKLPFLQYITAGPEEFVSLVSNAKFVLTDSFHGTAFSINFNVPFYTFARNYGSVRQTSRITSLLQTFGLEKQYIECVQQVIKSVPSLDFTRSNEILTEQRKKAEKYLKETLNGIKV